MAKLNFSWTEAEIGRIIERYGLPLFSIRNIQYIREMERDSTTAFLREAIAKCVETIQATEDHAELFVKYVLPLVEILQQREEDLKEMIEKDYGERTKFY